MRSTNYTLSPTRIPSRSQHRQVPRDRVADARDRHFELRSLLERGVDPLDSRRQELADRKVRVAEAKSAGDEFEAFSKRLVRERLLTKSATYRKQIESRLERFVWPAIGAKSLNAVRPADVLELRSQSSSLAMIIC